MPAALGSQVTVRYNCLWRACSFSSGDALRFDRHVDSHVSTTAAAASSSCSSDASRDEGSSCRCCWAECRHFVSRDVRQFRRHVLLHGYQRRLELFGDAAMRQQRAPACARPRVSVAASGAPCHERPFVCRWQQCHLALDEPATFFAHVRHHVQVEEAMGREQQQQQRGGGENGGGGGGTPAVCLWRDCGRQLSDGARAARLHAGQHSGERAAACSGCGRHFSGLHLLLVHRWRQHTNTVAGSERGRHPCRHCRRRFGCATLLRRHVVACHTERRACPVCRQLFPVAALNRHVRRVHTHVQRLVCAVCNAVFRHKANLLAHQRLHHDQPQQQQKRYQCSFCSVSHRQRSFIVFHERRRHADQVGSASSGDSVAKRVYACHLCPAHYCLAAFLTHHLRRHHPAALVPGVARQRYVRRPDGCYSLLAAAAAPDSAPPPPPSAAAADDDDDEQGVEQLEPLQLAGVVCVRRVGEHVPAALSLPDGRSWQLPQHVRQLLLDGFSVLLLPSGPDRRRFRLLSVTCGLPLTRSSAAESSVSPSSSPASSCSSTLQLEVDAVQAALLGVPLPQTPAAVTSSCPAAASASQHPVT